MEAPRVSLESTRSVSLEAYLTAGSLAGEPMVPASSVPFSTSPPEQASDEPQVVRVLSSEEIKDIFDDLAHRQRPSARIANRVPLGRRAPLVAPARLVMHGVQKPNERYCPTTDPRRIEMYGARVTAYDPDSRYQDALSRALFDMPSRQLHHGPLVGRPLPKVASEPTQHAVPALTDHERGLRLKRVQALEAPYCVDDYYSTRLDVIGDRLAVVLGGIIYTRDHVSKQLVVTAEAADHTAICFIGPYIVSGDISGRIRVYNSQTLQPVPLVDTPVPFSGQVVAIEPLSANAFVYTTMRGTTASGRGALGSLVLMKIVKSAAQLGSFRLVRLDTKLLSSGGLGIAVKSPKPNRCIIAIGKNNGVAELFKIEGNKLCRFERLQDRKKPHTGGVKGIAWHPKYPLLAVGGGNADKTVKLWRYAQGKSRCVLTIEVDNQVSGCVWSKDGKRLSISTGYTSADVRVYRIQPCGNKYIATLLHQTTSQGGRIIQLKRDPKGRLWTLVTGTESAICEWSGFESKPRAPASSLGASLSIR